jgi:hypothetical protein
MYEAKQDALVDAAGESRRGHVGAYALAACLHSSLAPSASMLRLRDLFRTLECMNGSDASCACHMHDVRAH